MDLILNYGPKSQIMDFFLDGLKIQSSELSPPWLSAAGAFFCEIFCFFDLLESLFANKCDF